MITIEEPIPIPEEIYEEICIILDCDYITFMGIA